MSRVANTLLLLWLPLAMASAAPETSFATSHDAGVAAIGVVPTHAHHSRVAENAEEEARDSEETPDADDFSVSIYAGADLALGSGTRPLAARELQGPSRAHRKLSARGPPA